jgi:hypothetical protein
MAKNAIIIHGTKDSPELYWFPYVKKGLEEKGYKVWAPHMPSSDKPNRKDWIPFILENWEITPETVLIGHSAGAQIIPSVLEKIDVKIKQVIMVSGYAKALRKDRDSENSVDDFNWDAIKGKAEEFIFINSDNDPWTNDDKQGKILSDHLGGRLIVMHGEGHMGSGYFNQPYKEFPLILELIK